MGGYHLRATKQFCPVGIHLRSTAASNGFGIALAKTDVLARHHRSSEDRILDGLSGGYVGRMLGLLRACFDDE